MTLRRRRIRLVTIVVITCCLCPLRIAIICRSRRTSLVCNCIDCIKLVNVITMLIIIVIMIIIIIIIGCHFVSNATAFILQYGFWWWRFVLWGGVVFGSSRRLVFVLLVPRDPIPLRGRAFAAQSLLLSSAPRRVWATGGPPARGRVARVAGLGVG